MAGQVVNVEVVVKVANLIIRRSGRIGSAGGFFLFLKLDDSQDLE